MNESNEKFFEELAEEKLKADKDFVKVELAKSRTLAAKPGIHKDGHEEENRGEEGQLTIDVYQTADALVVQSAIAGVQPDDIDVDVTSDSVTIRGERKRETHVREEDYLYRECYWGRFSRSIVLPQEIDPEKAVVNFKNGILVITLPKVNRERLKKLKVKPE